MIAEHPRAPLDVVIIAQNEQLNIEHAVNSVMGWARQVFVVDAFSTDSTAALAEHCGACVVQHEFVNWAEQRNWALENLPLSADWGFFLDADEYVTEQFRACLSDLLDRASREVTGVTITARLHFLGRTLEHAYSHPRILRIVRKGHARWVGVGAREHGAIEGPTEHVAIPIEHLDHRGISHWIEKQNRNATREALARRTLPVSLPAGLDRANRLWAREHLLDRIPPYIRPLVLFIYFYVFRFGFLDGTAGFAYCFLYGFWYHLLIALKVDELRFKSGLDK